jgi:putative ABC transport system permease protein
MHNIRWVIVLRELFSNKARTSLVVLSIAVGVFAMGTIVNSWIILVKDLNDAYAATHPASAVLSVSSFDDDLVSAAEGMREVAQAEGRAAVVVKLNTPQGEQINLTLYAVEDYRGLELNQMTPENPGWPPPRRQLWVGQSRWKPLTARITR